MAAFARISVITSCALWLVAGQVSAQPAEPKRASLARVEPQAIDAIFAPWAKPDTPGAALAVIQDGRIVYEKGYGMANLANGTPITPETAFYIGSVSKQFAAASLALLAERGVISLDDDVRRHVPELPDFGPITLRQLVHHTSGLRDYLSLRSIAGAPGDGNFGDADVLALLRRQKALNFPPGTAYSYSNSGYFLISVIVKRTTGKSLREFAAENIFGPLQMRTAVFRDDHRMPIKNRADGYAGTAGNYRVSNPNFDVVGAGGVFMTVRDFVSWDQNFYTPKVGTPALIEQLQTVGTLNNGTKLTYAFGLTIGRFRGLPIVEHGGSYGGFRAHVIRFPAQRLSVVCFSNFGGMTPGALVRRVASLYLRDAMEAAPATVPAIAEGGDGTTTAPKAKGKKRSVPATALREFAGRYYSEELDVTHTLALRGNTLWLEAGQRAPSALQSSGKDTFALGTTTTLVFTRAADGTPQTFTVDGGRARGIVFSRR